MNAGRELDALIAEKVLGLECGIINGNPKIRGSNCGTHGCTKHWIDTPEYSTDMSSAWQIILHFQKQGKSFELTWDAHETNKEFTISNFNNEMLPYRGWSSEDEPICESSDSAPHAICLAALKVVGYNVYNL